MVVQPGAAQLGFGQLEAERLDEVQFASRRRDHADRVTGVGCDPRRVKHDAKHLTMIAGAPEDICSDAD